MASLPQNPDTDRRIAMDARDWIVRLTSGDADELTLTQFRRWYDLSPAHQQAFERERTFWADLDQLRNDAPITGHHPATRPAAAPLIGRRTLLLGSGAAAATAAAIVAAPMINLWRQTDLATRPGEQAERTLPDGSLAALNTDTALALHFTAKERVVRLLKGEAEFRVRPMPDMPFRVIGGGGSAEALGTVFAVKRFADETTVTVREGRVRVSGGQNTGDVELGPDQQTSYAPGVAPGLPARVDMDVALAWRAGRIILDGRPFARALDELGRYLPEPLLLAPVARREELVSAIVSTSDVLSGMAAIARTQGLSVRRIPRVVIVVS